MIMMFYYDSFVYLTQIDFKLVIMLNFYPSIICYSLLHETIVQQNWLRLSNPIYLIQGCTKGNILVDVWLASMQCAAKGITIP